MTAISDALGGGAVLPPPGLGAELTNRWGPGVGRGGAAAAPDAGAAGSAARAGGAGRVLGAELATRFVHPPSQ
jgi:hypothetical protein